jgi:hypothetical protein
MTELADRSVDASMRIHPIPDRPFEEAVGSSFPRKGTLLDAGCGRTAPVLQKFRSHAGRLISVDMVQFACAAPDVELLAAGLASISVESGSVDVVMSRSVFGHLKIELPCTGNCIAC